MIGKQRKNEGSKNREKMEKTQKEQQGYRRTSEWREASQIPVCVRCSSCYLEAHLLGVQRPNAHIQAEQCNNSIKSYRTSTFHTFSILLSHPVASGSCYHFLRTVLPAANSSWTRWGALADPCSPREESDFLGLRPSKALLWSRMPQLKT